MFSRGGSHLMLVGAPSIPLRRLKSEKRTTNILTYSRNDPPVIDLLVDSRVGKMEFPRAC